MTAAAAARARLPGGIPILGRGVAMAMVLALSTILIRAPHFGDPSYHIDEQFYLLVGRSMLDGALPYVDIWDRKPLGLFLLYAGIASLGGTGVYAYHAVAGLFVFATACVLARIGRRAAGPVGGMLCGIFYVAMLEPLAGGGGQSPVFYNLFIALAFHTILRISDRPAERLLIRSAGAMALCSLAVFVKPTAIVESLAFGMILLALVYRQQRKAGAVAVAASVFAVIGLAPTALAFAYYALIGHAAEFWFANFVSIFTKPPLPHDVSMEKLRYLLAIIMPCVVAGLAGLAAADWRSPPNAVQTRLTALWLGAALLGFLSVPNFYDHYALPLAAPLAAGAAPAFARGAVGAMIWAIPTLWSLYVVHYPDFAGRQRSTAGIAAAEAAIERHLDGGCMYMFDGPIYLYALTGACRVTPYVFPEHLNLARESGAIGIDPAAEMRRIVAARPRVIVTATDVHVGPPNPVTTRILEDALAARYTLAEVVDTEVHRVPRRLRIWVLRPATGARPG